MSCTISLHESWKSSPDLLAQNCDRDEQRQDLFDGTYGTMWHCRNCKSTLLAREIDGGA